MAPTVLPPSLVRELKQDGPPELAAEFTQVELEVAKLLMAFARAQLLEALE